MFNELLPELSAQVPRNGMKEPDLTPSLKMDVTAMEVVEPEQRLCSGSHCSATMHLAKQRLLLKYKFGWLCY